MTIWLIYQPNPHRLLSLVIKETISDLFVATKLAPITVHVVGA